MYKLRVLSRVIVCDRTDAYSTKAPIKVKGKNKINPPQKLPLKRVSSSILNEVACELIKVLIF